MSTNAGSLFMSFHPLWAAEGAEVALAAQGSVTTCGQSGQVGQMVARDLTSLSIVACQIATNNKLAGYCLANKSSNQYLKSRNDLYFCPKAGDFFPKKGWHTNSWCCINEWIKQQVQKQAAVSWIALKLTCFVKTEGYSARGWYVWVCLYFIVSVLLFPQLCFGLPNVRNGESIPYLTMIKLKERKEAGGKKRTDRLRMEKISWLLLLEVAIPLALKDREFQSPSVWTTVFEPLF